MRAILFGLVLLLTAPAMSPAGATEPRPAAAATQETRTAATVQPAAAQSRSRPMRQPGGGDGPAWVLNGFVLKEAAQCRQEDAGARRDCCERLLHPNACR